MIRDFLGLGFFGNRHFGSEDRTKFTEDWDKMSDSEKLEIMNKRMAAFKAGKNCREEAFSVEQLDARCNEWMSKTPEEKAQQVEEMKKKFEDRRKMMEAHFSHHHFGGFQGRGHHHDFPFDK